jgi:hypothetical protein
MNICEFISYVKTPAEKHLGIVTVKLYGKIILRFKIVQTKDGKSTFPNAASYKITDDSGERYIPAFMLDSRSEQEEVEHVIRAGVKKSLLNESSYKASAPVQMSGSLSDDSDVPF